MWIKCRLIIFNFKKGREQNDILILYQNVEHNRVSHFVIDLFSYFLNNNLCVTRNTLTFHFKNSCS